MYVYDSVSEAFCRSLEHLRARGMTKLSTRDPDSPGSHFGKKQRLVRELIGFGFDIMNPRDRIVNVGARRANPIFSVANALWILDGRNDLEFIKYYNERGKDFSDDGETLYGAYGARLFHGCSIDQVHDGILSHLQKDPYTRRAFAVVAQPRDTTAHSRDIPCLLDIQFHFSPSNELDMIATMRSQSAAMVMPYDLFALTFFHEAIATTLGFPLGVYRHRCGSFHYYLEEEPLVERIIADQKNGSAPCPPMPPGIFPWLGSTLALEKMMREGQTPPEDRMEQLPLYWRELLHVLSIATRKDETVFSKIPLRFRSALSL